MTNRLIMALIDNSLLKSKFRGCFLGSLLGDCLGGPFEGEAFGYGNMVVVQKYFDKLDGPYFSAPRKDYTDDTAMTRSVAQCLLDLKEVEPTHMAKLFVKEFYNNPRRGYGGNVVEVFSKLQQSKFSEPLRPAQEQFNGTGSYGNGGAMRISPIALYFYNDFDAMIENARAATQITHTNDLGINGAILQCIAVQQSLLSDPRQKMDPAKFADSLLDKMQHFETDDKSLGIELSKPYRQQLLAMKNLLDVKDGANEEEVVKILGNSISALHSVPTAIFCFLRSLSEIPEIKTDNPFRRTIQYAISLGGDTDTIASMAGSIAGAYYGAERISESLQKHCETVDISLKMADDLFALKFTNEKDSE